MGAPPNHPICIAFWRRSITFHQFLGTSMSGTPGTRTFLGSEAVEAASKSWSARICALLRSYNGYNLMICAQDYLWLVVDLPLWKIWVCQWEGWHPIYIYIMENKNCAKPPTRSKCGLTMIDIRDCPWLCLLKGITMYHGRTLLEHGSPFTGTQLFTNQLLCVLIFVGYCKTPGWKQKKQDHLTSIRLTYPYSERRSLCGDLIHRCVQLQVGQRPGLGSAWFSLSLQLSAMPWELNRIPGRTGTHFLFPVNPLNPLNFRWTLEFPGGQVHMVTRQRKLLDMDKKRQFGAVNL